MSTIDELKESLKESSGRNYKFDSGKYIYNLSTQRNNSGIPKLDEFDVDKFNRVFEQYKQKTKEATQVNLDPKKYLNEGDLKKESMLYEQSISSLLIKTKDSFFLIVNDILSMRINYDTFTKDYRMFHMGILMLIASAIIYVYINVNDNLLDLV